MINGIKSKFKQISGAKFLNQAMKKPFVPVERSHGIATIGCIVDLDAFDSAEEFYQLQEEFNLRPNTVKIIGYKENYDKTSPYSTPVFSENDLGWKGEIINGYVNEFLSREYDLLINYYKKDGLLLKLMSVKSKARIRVGFTEMDTYFNDLILNVPLKDVKIFKTELKKYLGVLDEIKL